LELTFLDDNERSKSDNGDDDLLMMITGTGNEQLSMEV
jgi:hypothetical protein